MAQAMKMLLQVLTGTASREFSGTPIFRACQQMFLVWNSDKLGMPKHFPGTCLLANVAALKYTQHLNSTQPVPWQIHQLTFPKQLAMACQGCQDRMRGGFSYNIMRHHCGSLAYAKCIKMSSLKRKVDILNCPKLSSH